MQLSGTYTFTCAQMFLNNLSKFIVKNFFETILGKFFLKGAWAFPNLIRFWNSTIASVIVFVLLFVVLFCFAFSLALCFAKH